MDIAEAMKLFEEANPDAAKIVQGRLTEVNGEAGTNRKKASELSKEKENLLGLLGAIAEKLGVDDVTKVPEKVTETSTELKALQKNLEDVSRRLDEKDSIIERGTIEKKLTGIFDDLGFSDPEYHAGVYAEKAKKGETGIMIGDDFAKDFGKKLAEKHPSFLSKTIKAPKTKEETNLNATTQTKTSFTDAEIEAMSDEEFEKNMGVILTQEEV